MLSKQSLLIVGLDLSLSSTGVCINDNGKIVTHTIKTKPRQFANQWERYSYIAGHIINTIRQLQKPPDVVVIEDVFTSKCNPQVSKKLTELGAIVKYNLWINHINFIVVEPKKLKKLFTGNGNASKNSMAATALKIHCKTFSTNDECDAFALTTIFEKI